MNISRFYYSCSVGSKIRRLPEPGRSSEWHQSPTAKWFLSSWRTNTENISTQVWSDGFRTFRTDNLYVTRTRCYFVSHSWFTFAWTNVNQLKIDDPRSTTLLFKSIWAWTNVAWICSFTGHTVTLDLLQTSGVGCLETHTRAHTHTQDGKSRWGCQKCLEAAVPFCWRFFFTPNLKLQDLDLIQNQILMSFVSSMLGRSMEIK